MITPTLFPTLLYLQKIHLPSNLKPKYVYSLSYAIHRSKLQQ